MKKSRSNLKKLPLSKETLRTLAETQLQQAIGGDDIPTLKCGPTANCSITC